VSPEAPDSPLSRRGVVPFWRRYGREPARVDRIDARSVTALSEPGAELLLVHVEAAELAGRPVELRPSPAVTRVLTGREPGAGTG
jgi:hypothetical protein